MEYVEDNREEKPVIKKDMDGLPISKDEVELAMRKMKHKKAARPDTIIASLEDIGIEITTKLLNAIYDSGKISEDLSQSVFIVLPQSSGATGCELHRQSA